METKKMAYTAWKALDDKKADDIKIIDIHEISTLADYFIIAGAGSAPQVQACMDEVEEQMHKAGYALQRTEGNRDSSWVLMDFKDIVVHIFLRDDRLFYDLERIWSDGKQILPDEIMSE